MNRERAIAVWVDLNTFALQSNGALWGAVHRACRDRAGSKHDVEVALGSSVTFS